MESGELEKIFEAREKKGDSETVFIHYSILEEDDRRKKLQKKIRQNTERGKVRGRENAEKADHENKIG